MKKNLILMILLIALGMLVYVAKNRKEIKDREQIKRILHFEENSVFKWEIHYDGIHLICEKQETNYVLSGDKKYFVPSDSFLANVKNFNTLDYIGVVGSTNDEKQWGIDRNQYYKMYYRDRKGREKTHTLFRGSATIAPRGYYLCVSTSDKVYSVEEWVVKALEKKLEELRDKDFLKVEPEEIINLKLGHRLNIVKVGKYWSVNGRATNKINIRSVDGLIQNIAFLRADKVLATNVVFDDIKEKLTITYQKKEDSDIKKIELYLGKEGDRYYAKLPGIDATYEIGSLYAGALTNSITHYYLSP